MESSVSYTETAAVPPRYATFTRRFRATLADAVIVFVCVVIVAIFVDATGRVSGSGIVAWLVMFSLFFLYEPLFIWRRGATIGHTMNHLTVVADGTGRAPSLPRAFARYFIKLVLGLPSFVTMVLSRRHQAMHDLLTRTTVQLAASVDPDVADFHLERANQPTTPLPSRFRRTVVALGYLIALFLVYGIILLAIDPNGCVRAHNCSASMEAITHVVTLVWVVASVASVAAVWKGLMLGARRGC